MTETCDIYFRPVCRWHRQAQAGFSGRFSCNSESAILEEGVVERIARNVEGISTRCLIGEIVFPAFSAEARRCCHGMEGFLVSGFFGL